MSLIFAYLFLSLRVMIQTKVKEFVVTGDVCLACFSENQWVRAEILELTPTTVSLIYIDYGYMETMARER